MTFYYIHFSKYYFFIFVEYSIGCYSIMLTEYTYQVAEREENHLAVGLALCNFKQVEKFQRASAVDIILSKKEEMTWLRSLFVPTSMNLLRFGMSRALIRALGPKNSGLMVATSTAMDRFAAYVVPCPNRTGRWMLSKHPKQSAQTE